MHEDDPVTRIPATSAGSPQSSTGAAEMPEPPDTPQGSPSPAGNEGQTPLSPSTDAVDTVASDVSKPHGRVLRRVMILLGLALVGLATGIWALILFPTRSAVANPTPLNLDFYPGSVPSEVIISINPEIKSSTEVVVQAVPIGTIEKAHKGPTVAFNLYDGFFKLSCSSGTHCQSNPFSRAVMDFTLTDNFPPPTRYFTVNDLSLQPNISEIKNLQISAASNGASAIVELPTVNGFGSSASPQQKLLVVYYVPNADAYDWSTPPLIASGDYVQFFVQLSTTLSASAEEITGVDHQAETLDENHTFVAGILLGVAGGAVIAAVQEGLHMVFDSRDDPRRREPSRPSTSG